MKEYRSLKKHQWIYFLLSVFVLTQFFGALDQQNVLAATGETEIETFDTYGAGVSSGTNDYLTFFGNGFGTSTSYKFSSPNSVYWYQYTGKYMYLNLTNNLTMNGIEISMYDNAGTGANSDLTIQIYNQTGIEIVRFYLSCDTIERYIKVYDYASSSYQTLCATSSSIFQKYITIGFQNNHTVGTSPINYIYYYMKNQTGSITYSTEKSWNSSYEWNTNDQMISKMFFNTYGTTTGSLYVYFDDITVLGSEFEDTGYGSIGEEYDAICSGGVGLYQAPLWEEVDCNPILWWICETTWYFPRFIEIKFPYKFTGSIKALDLQVGDGQIDLVSNTLNDYNVYFNGIALGSPDYIQGNEEGGYVLRWIDTSTAGLLTLSNEYPIMSFESEEYVTFNQNNYYWWEVGWNWNYWDSMIHSTDSLHTDSYINGNYVVGNPSVCFYYLHSNEQNMTNELDDDDLQAYKDEYGSSTYNDTFIQFYGEKQECYYGVESSANILYYVTDEYLEEDSPYYMYSIYRVGYNLSLYDGLITLGNDNNRSGLMNTKDAFQFKSVGEYYIILFNTTSYGTVKNELIYSSKKIMVCEKSSSGSEQEEEESVLEKQQGTTNIMIGLFVSLGLGIGLLLVTKEPIVFLAGTGAAAFIFSQEGLGSYQFLPTEIGYGLIVVLVLVAVVTWLLN